LFSCDVGGEVGAQEEHYVGDRIHGRSPRHTAFTRMPWRAASPGAVLGSPITACFDATHAGMPDVATRPATESVLTAAPEQDRS
jgi:hypothetical protein